jgi:hypothetical protein
VKNYTHKKTTNDSVCYYDENWKLHRIGGPAIIRSNGVKERRVNGKQHRTDGQAIEHNKASMSWWIHGKLHRIDGPAYIWNVGDDEWWVNDKRLNSPKFDKLQELRKIFNNDDFLSFLLLEERIVL